MKKKAAVYASMNLNKARYNDFYKFLVLVDAALLKKIFTSLKKDLKITQNWIKKLDASLTAARCYLQPKKCA